MESSLSSETNKSSWKEAEREEVRQKTIERIREIISTLPEGNFFGPLRLYQGYWFHPHSLEGLIFAQEHFRAKAEDIFLCTPPKTGTTWLKALSFATITRTHFDNSESPLLSKLPHLCVPFLEKHFINNYSTSWKSNLPFLSTHVPYSWLPKSVIDSGCKIVYICRNPKDVFVSLWHFMKKAVTKNCQEISLEEAFNLFCEGTSPDGPYWYHVLGYWEASLQFPDRILFLKYEEMMENTVFFLKKLAEFMGCPFSLEEEKEGAVKKIVDLCSFDNLSNLEVNKTGISYLDELTSTINNAFFRKGKIGDWKNYLTSEMGERLDKIMEERLGGSGLKLF